MVFPRVGRDKTHKTDKRNEGSNNGLWFGPRLGRLQKRDSPGSSQSETPWALITLRGKFISITFSRCFEPCKISVHWF